MDSEINVTLTDSSCDACLNSFLLKNAPDFVEMVPNHWLETAEPERIIQIGIGIALIFICTPAIIGQLSVLISYYRSNILKTASNHILMSLLSADFLLLLNCTLPIYQNMKGVPTFGVYGCKVSGFFGSVAALSEIWSLCAVSVDRLRCVSYPLNYNKKITKSKAKIIIAFVWTMSVLFSMCPLFGWSRFVNMSFGILMSHILIYCFSLTFEWLKIKFQSNEFYESLKVPFKHPLCLPPYYLGCIFDMYSASWNTKSYGLVLFVFCYVCPILMIVFSYHGIIYNSHKTRQNLLPRKISLLPTLRKHSSKIDKNDDNDGEVENKNSSIPARTNDTIIASKGIYDQQKLVVSLYLLILFWILSWTPYAIISIWGLCFDGYKISPNMALLPLICCKLGAAINVMMYGIRLPAFKVEMKKMRKRDKAFLSNAFLNAIGSNYFIGQDKRRVRQICQSMQDLNSMGANTAIQKSSHSRSLPCLKDEDSMNYFSSMRKNSFTSSRSSHKRPIFRNTDSSDGSIQDEYCMKRPTSLSAAKPFRVFATTVDVQKSSKNKMPVIRLLSPSDDFPFIDAEYASINEINGKEDLYSNIHHDSIINYDDYMENIGSMLDLADNL